jgi:hypothetical protein
MTSRPINHHSHDDVEDEGAAGDGVGRGVDAGDVDCGAGGVGLGTLGRGCVGAGEGIGDGLCGGIRSAERVGRVTDER